MRYGLTLVTPPNGEPLTLEQVKAHVRSDESADDDELTILLKTARRYVEKATNRIMLSQVWQLTMDHFPGFGWDGHRTYRGDGLDLWDGIAFKIPLSPVQAIGSVNYVDTTGTPQVVDPSLYHTDLIALPARVSPAFGTIWPIARYQTGAVSVTFTAGYGGSQDVPEDLLTPMLLLLSHWYEHREAVAAGAYQQVPLSVQALLGINWDGAVTGQY